MDSILIGGKERPVLIGWGTLKEFGKETKRSFGQVFSVSDLSFDDIEILIFTSLKYGARNEGQEFDVKRDDVSGWIDKDIKVVPKFIQIFQDQLTAALDEKNV